MNKLRLLLLLTPVWCWAQNVVFTDPNLKTVLTSPATEMGYAAYSADYEPLIIDANGDGEIQLLEAQAVYKLGISYVNISDLGGLESFTNLQALDLFGLNLANASFDFSAFADLQSLFIMYCDLSGITLSGMNALQYAYISNSQLEEATIFNLPALTSLDLSVNNLQSVAISDVPQLSTLGVAQNQLSELSLTGMPALTELNAGQNLLSSIDVSGAPLLKTLSLDSNLLTSLDLSQNTQLQALLARQNIISDITLPPSAPFFQIALGQNQLTSFTVGNQPDLVLLDLSNNQLTSVDLSGAPSLEDFFVDSNALTSLDLSNNPQLRSLQCTNNQMTALDLSNKPNLSYLVCSFNQITAIEAPDSPYLYTLMCENNQLTSIDLSPYQYLSYLYVSNNQLTSLDVSGLYYLGEIRADGNQFVNLDFSDATYAYLIKFLPNDLLQTANLKNNGYQSPFFADNDFSSSTAPALQFLCVDDFEQSEFQAYIQAINPNIIVNAYCSFDLSGEYNIISGTVRFDFGNDGCSDADTPVAYAKVFINSGEQGGATFTDANGNFSFVVPDGSYTFGLEPDTYPGFNVSPALSNATFNDETFSGAVTNDICLQPSSTLFDGEITVLPFGVPYYGFDTYYQISVRNKGNQVISGNVAFEFEPAAATASFAFPFADTAAPGQLTFNINDLLPFETRTIFVILNYSTENVENPWLEAEPIPFTATFNVVQEDANPDDNVFAFVQPVSNGAEVQNRVSCMEGESVDPTEIGDYLHYAINFENVGDETAPFVALRSEIDPSQFDINSVEVLNATMPAQIKVIDNVLELVFEDAQLAPGAEGSVLLRMKSNDALQPGDTVKFKTAVYLDYDMMVQTNEAQTTFETSLSNGDFTTPGFTVHPNPAKDRFRIQSSSPVRSVSLFDMQGRKLRDLRYSEEGVSVETVPTGVYFVKATTEAGTAVTKLVKQ